MEDLQKNNEFYYYQIAFNVANSSEWNPDKGIILIIKTKTKPIKEIIEYSFKRKFPFWEEEFEVFQIFRLTEKQYIRRSKLAADKMDDEGIQFVKKLESLFQHTYTEAEINSLTKKMDEVELAIEALDKSMEPYTETLEKIEKALKNAEEDTNTVKYYEIVFVAKNPVDEFSANCCRGFLLKTRKKPDKEVIEKSINYRIPYWDEDVEVSQVNKLTKKQYEDFINRDADIKDILKEQYPDDFMFVKKLENMFS